MLKKIASKLFGLTTVAALCMIPGQAVAQSGVVSGIVSISKTAPPLVALGQDYVNTVTIRANESAGNVVVRDTIPSGASFVKSEPAATKQGNTLTWNIAKLAAGASQTITITLKAEKEGEFGSCATVQAVPLWCVTTKIGKPKLAITKSGPSSAVINEAVSYNITVSNPGNMTANNVVVTDTIPAGLRHSSGQSTMSWTVGDLAPGASRTFPIVLTAAKGGKHCNQAVATSSNAGKVEAEACTTVLVPGLNIAKTGPKLQFLGKFASYDIKVTNSGETTLTDVIVTDTAPAATKISSAPGASVVGNTAVWRVASLAPKAEKTFKVVLTTMIAGTHQNCATVSSSQGLSGRSCAATDWQGLSALLITVEDDPDPIQLGEMTTYTIKVTNQGTADDTNVKLVAEFDAEVTPVTASNGGAVAGKTVTFPAYPRLSPKQSFTYTIQAKGAKAGDHRLKVIRTSTDIPKPTTAEESTRVY